MNCKPLAVFVLGLASTAGQAQQKDPWEYHGIRLGARMTQDQIMHALNAEKYVKNPKYDPWNSAKGCADKPDQKVCKEADFYKYGMQAIEKEEFDVGPSCEDKSLGNFDCVNPQMSLSIPNWMEKGHCVSRVWHGWRGWHGRTALLMGVHPINLSPRGDRVRPALRSQIPGLCDPLTDSARAHKAKSRL